VDKQEKRRLGIYEKFIVRRADRDDRLGYKHEGCKYFVLDLTHDPFAIPALKAYAEACEKDGYATLAHDLRAAAASLETGLFL
jgi:hypothetical protein